MNRSPDAQATSFDAVGDLYARFRPPYPDSLFAEMISRAGVGAHSRLLEIGSGTGVATVPIASRGFSLLCLEPGPRLAALLRQKLVSFPRTAVIETTFEQWSGDPESFELVFSAQAFHWLDASVRFQKVAAVLRPGGWLAVFGHVYSLADPEIRRALDDVYAEHAPELRGPSRTTWYAHDGPIPGLFADSALFEPAQVSRFPWQTTYSTAAYQGLLQTMSDHQALPESRRQRLLDDVARVVDRFGGSIELTLDDDLFMARRA